MTVLVSFSMQFVFQTVSKIWDAGEDLARMLDQQLEDLELLGSQADRFVVQKQVVGIEVDFSAPRIHTGWILPSAALRAREFWRRR